MLHKHIENEEVIERYVRNRLATEERLAFEEHFFACDDCFAKVREMEKFVAGIRDAAESGTLPSPEETAASPFPAKWFLWALTASTCMALVLALAVGWLTLRTLPRLRADLNTTTAQVQSQQQIIARLQEVPNPQETPEANVPLVMLQASRGDEAAETVLPTGAKRVVLWVETGPTRYRSYRMEISSASGEPVAAIENLIRGPYGAIAASLPSDRLPPGVFRITLTGQAPPPASLVGEYRLRVRKP